MNAYDSRDYLFENLKHLGCIEWHNNATSYYLKFKDCRIGSIRLSNHQSRKRYHYKFEYIKPNGKFEKKKLDKIIDEIHMKVLELKGFNPNKYIVFKNKEYVEIKEKDYRKHILN